MTTRLRTPLAKIEGLGSAKAGTLHFWHQRMTAVALVPLSIWFAASALAYVGADQGAVATYFAEPLNAVPMFLFIIASTYHMSLGMQIIIEDYIHQEGQKIAALMLNRFAAWAIGAASTFALIKMALH
ncbi:MAG TPA: succinate dehydrogenase, hydrophobic membrane anchor protein [Micropepsaceae bacterium]|jgi:succinate dehydrogenase / fumarate reductase membrane anchor subunit|nr:succinate dehydrogenase, hydrophobic membrane anchor protein [Micropepsaceae bacterium]